MVSSGPYAVPTELAGEGARMTGEAYAGSPVWISEAFGILKVGSNLIQRLIGGNVIQYDAV